MVFKLHFPRSLSLGLNVSREGTLNKVAKFLGGQDIEVGDAEFDGALTVKGTHRNDILDFLTPVRRDKIMAIPRSVEETKPLRLSHTVKKYEITDDSISWSKGFRKADSDPGRIVDRVLQLADLADALTS